MGSIYFYVLFVTLFSPSVIASIRLRHVRTEPCSKNCDQAVACKPYIVKKTDNCLSILTNNNITKLELEGFNKKTRGRVLLSRNLTD
jgi:hypothetical protein